MSVTRLRLAPMGETMFPPQAPFFRSRLGVRAVAIVVAGAEDRDVVCDVAEEAVPALPAWPLPQRGNLPVSLYAPSTAHRHQVGQ